MAVDETEGLAWAAVANQNQALFDLQLLSTSGPATTAAWEVALDKIIDGRIIEGKGPTHLPKLLQKDLRIDQDEIVDAIIDWVSTMWQGRDPTMLPWDGSESDIMGYFVAKRRQTKLDLFVAALLHRRHQQQQEHERQLLLRMRDNQQ